VAYRIAFRPAARCALHSRLPEPVAAACVEFIFGALADNPHRVGKPLRAPLEGIHSARRGEFRVLYTIDDGTVTVLIIAVQHRRDAYGL
jgi:mRNA-degrading endonuclease RelE of RelBE toxin-antitoxin system